MNLLTTNSVGATYQVARNCAMKSADDMIYRPYTATSFGTPETCSFVPYSTADKAFRCAR